MFGSLLHAIRRPCRKYSLFAAVVAFLLAEISPAFGDTATVSGAASQTVKGWGSFPSYFRSDWSATHQDDMFDKPDIQDADYQLGITHIRVDLEPRLYVSGTSLSNIVLQSAAVNDLVQQIQIARNHGVTSYIMSCWSPPAVWKDSATIDGGHLIAADAPYFVNYYIKVLQTLNASGVGLPTAISVQNEPDISTSYDSCIYTTTSATGGGYAEWRQLVEQMRAALNSNGMSGVTVLGPESSNTDNDINLLGSSPNFGLMTDPTFNAALGAYASHTYSENIWLGLRSGMNAYPRDAWITEWSVDTNSAYGGTENGWTLATMQHMASNFVDIPYNYWTWWVEWGGGSAPQGTTLVAGTSSPVYSERYWVMQRLWNTVRPGWSVHHFSSSSDSNYTIINTAQNTWETQINLVSFWDPAGDASATMLINKTGTATSMTVNGLVGTNYQLYTSGTNPGMDAGPGGSVSAGSATVPLSGSSVNILIATSAPPSAPAGLTAAANTPLAAGGNARVTLSWPADYSATGYTVKRATVTGGPYTPIGTTATVLTLDDTNALPGNTYYYVVTALNPSGESASSNEASIPVPYLRAPLADAYVRDGSYATTNYGAAADLDVKLDTLNAGYTREAFLRFDVSGLSNAQSVKVWLVPLTVGATAWDTNPFLYEFVPNDTWIESGSGGITWSGSTARPIGSGTTFTNGNTGYFAGRIVEVDVTNLARSQAAGDGLLSMRIHSTVIAPNGDNWVDFGSRENTNPAYQPELVYTTAAASPSAPYGLTASAVNGQAALYWTPSAAATSYNVKRALTVTGSYSTIGTSVVTNYADTGLADGTTYYYVVSAINSAGESANSFPPVTAAPAAAVMTATAGNTQVTLSWTSGAAASSYNVKRAAVSGGPYTILASSTSASYIDTGLTGGTTYYYVASALFAGGNESANSSEASATPLATTNTLPATTVAANGATLNASVNPSGTDTTVYFQYGTTTSYGQTTAATDIGSGSSYVPTSATIASLLPNTVYHYEVVSTGTSGATYGTDQTFTTPPSIPAMPRWAGLLLALSLIVVGTKMLQNRSPGLRDRA